MTADDRVIVPQWMYDLALEHGPAAQVERVMRVYDPNALADDTAGQNAIPDARLMWGTTNDAEVVEDHARRTGWTLLWSEPSPSGHRVLRLERGVQVCHVTFTPHQRRISHWVCWLTTHGVVQAQVASASKWDKVWRKRTILDLLLSAAKQPDQP